MMFCSPVRGSGPSMVFSPAKSEFQIPRAAFNCAAVGAVPPTGKRPLRRRANKLILLDAVVWVAKKTLGMAATAVPGKFRLYQSKAANQNSLSLISAPPTPMPAHFRQSVGLKITGVNVPGAVCTLILVKGFLAPHTLSRS